MSRKNSQSWIKHFDFILLDLVSMQASLLLAFQTRHGMKWMYGMTLYRNTAISLILIDLIVMFFSESYKGILSRGLIMELKASFQHVTYVTAVLLLYLFVVQNGTVFSRIIFFTMWGIGIFNLWIVRCGWKKYLMEKRKLRCERSMVLVASSNQAEECIQSLTAKGYEPYRITGICLMDQDVRGTRINGIPVVAFEKDILDYIRANWVDEVFISIPKEHDFFDQLIQGCNEMGITIHVVLTRFSALDSGKQIVEWMGDYAVLSSNINIATERQRLLKRMMDIIGGLIGTIMTLLIALILGPVLYLQSPGPIFFTQERIGRNGKKFKMYKFRSMYLDAEKQKKELEEQNNIKDGMMFKIEDDPRIIHRKNGKRGIGHFIRRTSLDEFPQFFNVLRGEMSLVGTRPPTVDEWEKYELHHRARLVIKPGITGMWQVSGRNKIHDFEKVVALDTQYIQNWNLSLDIKILFKTVRIVLKQEGAS